MENKCCRRQQFKQKRGKQVKGDAHNFCSSVFVVTTLTTIFCVLIHSASSSPTSVLRMASEDQKMVNFKSSLNGFNFKFLNVINNQQKMKSDVPKDGIENVFYSPLSISTALGMVLSGANGSTKDQIISALDLDTNFGDGKDGINNQFERVITDYTSSSKLNGNSKILANKIFLNEEFNANEDYKEKMRNHFKAGIESQSLSSQSIVGLINDWVTDKTKGLINQMIDNPFDSMTQMVLLNAIYFKDDWNKKFNAKDTEKAPFKNVDGSQSMVDMMFKKDKIKFLINEQLNYSMIELPYKSASSSASKSSSSEGTPSTPASSGTSMVIVLPHEDEGILSLLSNESNLKTINEDAIKTIKKSFKTETNVYLPKFELETSYDLKDNLKQIGIDHLFDGVKCDLSGMSTPQVSTSEVSTSNISTLEVPNPETNTVETSSAFRGPSGNNLHVSSVIHKAKIIVNEEGSEAAAVTQVAISYRSMPMIEEFICNHPFIFMIKDNDLITFTGIMYKM